MSVLNIKDEATASIRGSTSSEHASSSRIDSAVDEKVLIRRIDYRLLPILFVVYVVAFLDRVNIANALTMGLPADLGLKGNEPNIALTVFFIPYILFELPSNYLFKKLRPCVWLSGCTVVFGVVTLAQGFVRSYSGLLTTRFLLGLAEAGVFPSSFYLISFWYKREDSQKRFTVYWCSTMFAIAFGGLLASGIAKMDGISGLQNWRWVFILEGLVTVVVGVFTFFLVPDFPEQSVWLTDAEREHLKEIAGVKEPSRVEFKDFGRFFDDFKRVLGAFMYFGIITPAYSYAYFAPTIIKSLGYSVIQTQLRSVPPVAVALVLTIAIAMWSDAVRLRSPFVVFGLVLVVVGLVLLFTIHRFAVQYASLFLVTMGVNTSGIVIICWYIMNLQGHSERMIGTAWMVSFGNFGGILATFTFVASDAPLYRKGYAICLGATCFCVVSVLTYVILIWRERKPKGKEIEETYSL